MTRNMYLLLGVDEGAPLGQVKRAYGRMMESLSADDLCTDSNVSAQIQLARQRLSAAFEALKDADVRRAYEDAFQTSDEEVSRTETDYCRPKLGQLLVASGLITMGELDAALEIQRNTKTTHVMLGQLLMATGYLTSAQLDYYLRQQELMRLPPDCPERWGQQLVELGFISEDQLKVALIEQQTTGCTLREAIINRGWLQAEVLDRIF